jgi:hypothetical protein
LAWDKKRGEFKPHNGGRIMRKVFGFVVAAAFVALAASASFAAFTPVGTPQKKTAKVNFTSTGTFSWNVSLNNIAGGTATEFTWNTATVTPGITNWANSAQYAVITSTLTSKGAAIRVYTDNAATTGNNYKCTASTMVAYAGLVAKTKADNPPLPMAWSIKEVHVSTTAVNPDSANGAVKFASLYFKDKTGLNAINNGEDFCTIVNNNGIKYGQGVGERGGSGSGTFYFYIAVNFVNAITPMEYGTDTLTFEGYTE